MPTTMPAGTWTVGHPASWTSRAKVAVVRPWSWTVTSWWTVTTWWWAVVTAEAHVRLTLTLTLRLIPSLLLPQLPFAIPPPPRGRPAELLPVSSGTAASATCAVPIASFVSISVAPILVVVSLLFVATTPFLPLLQLPLRLDPALEEPLLEPFLVVVVIFVAVVVVVVVAVVVSLLLRQYLLHQRLGFGRRWRLRRRRCWLVALVLVGTFGLGRRIGRRCRC